MKISKRAHRCHERETIYEALGPQADFRSLSDKKSAFKFATLLHQCLSRDTTVLDQTSSLQGGKAIFERYICIACSGINDVPLQTHRGIHKKFYCLRQCTSKRG